MKLTNSKRLAATLVEMGITSPIDVVNHVPYRYDDYRLSEELPLFHGKRLVLFGTAITAPTFTKAQRYQIVSFNFKSSSGRSYKVVAFNRPYLRSLVKLGESYTLIGNYDQRKYAFSLVTLRKGQIAPEDVIRPIYRLPNSIEQHVFHGLVERVFIEGIKSITDIVPAFLRDKYKLLPKKDALKKLHFPLGFEDVYAGLRVYKYEEALKFSIKTQLIRRQNTLLHKNGKPRLNSEKLTSFIASLPFKLSTDQMVATNEIIADMKKDTLMYRLLQGDVGSGKTAVAAIALYANYLRGDQGALMAPTDALAKQHFVTLSKFYQYTGIRIALLVGGLSIREKNNVKEALLDGLVDVVIGTHALFSSDVIYQSLGLAVIDEQHRFGVSQRSMLSNKGERADLLLMSATPIPRTLALTLFGDMDITTIKQFPFAKRQVTTAIHGSDDQQIEKLITRSLEEKRQVFIIAPLIDETDTSMYAAEMLYEMYATKYPMNVGLIHGRMSSEDKDAALTDFYTGRTPIIVSTTVIEVGIDVARANLMIVYDAHRFGLASLHQLRGRIGRDGTAAHMVLVTDIDNPQEHARLQVLSSSDDGFYIAEQDLAYRGPGELIGIRQAGLPTFSYVDVYKDYKMLELARIDAASIIENPPSDGQDILKIAQNELSDTPYA